jgi:hypothetical protein
MKFDCVIMNPPYQNGSGNKGLGTLWNKFVGKSLNLIKENGYLVAIHPSGWRGCLRTFPESLELKKRQIQYLEMHDEQDGIKTFGATTRYDWYVLRNRPRHQLTTVIDQSGTKVMLNLQEMPFIPNASIDQALSYIATENEDRVEVIHDYSYGSHYGIKNGLLSKQTQGKYKYPVIYSTSMNGPTIWYSSDNTKGHFGISKLVLNPSRPLGFVIDNEGLYGMSEFCVGILGNVKYLKMVGGVIENQKNNGFGDFMETIHFTNKIFNKDVISLFRKDFWKDFV